MCRALLGVVKTNPSGSLRPQSFLMCFQFNEGSCQRAKVQGYMQQTLCAIATMDLLWWPGVFSA